jgi:TolB-like protein/Flp pilus assembly protein TadD
MTAARGLINGADVPKMWHRYAESEALGRIYVRIRGRSEQSMSTSVRFGEFQADLRARELRRKGLRVAVQDQPFEVLRALLEQPGQLITRDTLQKRIWPEIAFIDSERGLNKAVNRLRDVLGDHSEQPQFIETLPKRGYRWIAPIRSDIRSLAVLPLADLSGEQSRAHWADGLTDELINQVAQISGVRVISRTSSLRFKQSELSLREIAQQLDVDAVIEGSVVVSEHKIGIRVQLIDPLVDCHIWASSYEAQIDEIVRLQREIARAIAGEVHGRLGPTVELHLATAAPRLQPEVYEEYMRGRLFWNRRTEADFEKAIASFERAIELDPRYPEPYVGVADSCIMLGIFGLRPPREVFPAARTAADRALSLDGASASAHTSLGTVLGFYDWNAPAAEKHYRRALELNPNSVTGHQWYGSFLSGAGRNNEAVASVEKARSLDPLSLVINAFLGLTYFKARQFTQAVRAARQAIEIDPNNPFAHYVLSRTLGGAGEFEGAVAEAEAACRLSANRLPFAAHIGYAYGCAGYRTKALAVLSELEILKDTRYVSAYEIAVIYIALDDLPAATQFLERCIEERAAKLTEILDPVFDRLRSEPVFGRILSELGLKVASSL